VSNCANNAMKSANNFSSPEGLGQTRQSCQDIPDKIGHRIPLYRRQPTGAELVSSRKPFNPTDKYVGGRVRMQRLSLGMSQTNLAEEPCVTLPQVQKYEEGAKPVNASRLQHIASVLRVPVAFFFDGGPNQFQSSGSD